MSVLYSVNLLDIAPQFASVLMGISNTVATIPGLLSPILTGHITKDQVCHLPKSVGWAIKQYSISENQ